MNSNQQLSQDLGRVLYMAVITSVFTEWLRKSSACPSGLKNKCLNAEASLKAITNHVMMNSSHNDWSKLKIDLSKDQLNDIANMLDLIANIDNIGEIVEKIKAAKQS